MAYGTAPAYAPPPYTPPRDPTDVMGRRSVAYLIDITLASAIFVALLAATKEQTFTGVDIDNGCAIIRNKYEADQCLQLGSRAYTWTGGAVALSWGLAALVGLLNNVILQTATGASVGKMIMGLRVVKADGQTAGLGRQFGRWLMLIVDAGLCFVGFFVALFTHPHRRLGDSVASTYVVGTADAGRPLEFAQPFAQPFAQQYGQPAYVPPPPGRGDWGQPQPQPQAGGWNQAPPGGWPQSPPQQQQPWGAPVPQPPSQWGAPAPQQQPPQQQPPSQWGVPAPQQPAPWDTPPQQPPSPQPPASEPPGDEAPPTSPPPSELWWDRAVTDGDDEPKQ